MKTTCFKGIVHIEGLEDRLLLMLFYRFPYLIIAVLQSGVKLVP